VGQLAFLRTRGKGWQGEKRPLVNKRSWQGKRFFEGGGGEY